MQLLLFNNKKSGIKFLDLAINLLAWNNTVFIFGYSNSREIYRNDYMSAIYAKKNNVANTFVFLGSELLNIKMSSFKASLLERSHLTDYGINDTLVQW